MGFFNLWVPICYRRGCLEELCKVCPHSIIGFTSCEVRPYIILTLEFKDFVFYHFSGNDFIGVSAFSVGF